MERTQLLAPDLAQESIQIPLLAICSMNSMGIILLIAIFLPSLKCHSFCADFIKDSLHPSQQGLKEARLFLQALTALVLLHADLHRSKPKTAYKAPAPSSDAFFMLSCAYNI